MLHINRLQILCTFKKVIGLYVENQTQTLPNHSKIPRLKSKPEKASAIADTPQTTRSSVSAENFTKACLF